MEKELKEKIAKIIAELEIVQYVYITKKDAFFVFKKAFRDHEVVEENYSDDGSGRPYFDGWVGNVSALDDCVIFHSGRLIEGKEIKGYISKYRTNIERSTPFFIDNIIEEEKIINEDKKSKFHSPRFLKPIKDLFREAGLIPEKRGGKGKKKLRHKYKRVIEERNKFIIKVYKEIIRRHGKPYRLYINYIHTKLQKYISERKRSPNIEEAEKESRIFDISNQQIRRVISRYKKK